MRWVGGEPEQSGLPAATSLDGDFEQSGLVRISTYIEHVQPAAVACRRRQVRGKRRFVVGGHGRRQDTGRPLLNPRSAVVIGMADQLAGEVAHRRIGQLRVCGRGGHARRRGAKQRDGCPQGRESERTGCSPDNESAVDHGGCSLGHRPTWRYRFPRCGNRTDWIQLSQLHSERTQVLWI